MLSECRIVVSGATTDSGSCAHNMVSTRCFLTIIDYLLCTEPPPTTSDASSEAIPSATSSDSTHRTRESADTTTTGPSTQQIATSSDEGDPAQTSPSNSQPDTTLTIVIIVIGAAVLNSLMFLLMLVIIVSSLCYKSKCRSRHSPVYEEETKTIVTKSCLHSDLVDKRNQHLNVSEATCAAMKDNSLTAAKTATTRMNSRVDNSQQTDMAADQSIAYNIAMVTEV